MVHNQRVSKIEQRRQASVRRAAEAVKARKVVQGVAVVEQGIATVVQAKRPVGRPRKSTLPPQPAPPPPPPLRVVDGARAKRQVARAAAASGSLGSAVSVLAPLPASFAWYDMRAALAGLGLLMPGAWVPAMVPWLSGRADRELTVTQSAEVTEAGLLSVFRMVDFSMSASIVDMTSGDGCVRESFERVGVIVRCNDLDEKQWAQSHLDAMQPMSYEDVRLACGTHVILLSPRTDLIDVMLPLGVRYARHVVCCYVPVMYLRHAHTLRIRFLRKLQDQGRVRVLPGAVRGKSQIACVWILVFATDVMACLMVKSATESICDLLPCAQG
jgi:hypothetical protein